MAESDPILGTDLIGDLSNQIDQLNQMANAMKIIAQNSAKVTDKLPQTTAELENQNKAFKDSVAATKAKQKIDMDLIETQIRYNMEVSKARAAIKDKIAWDESEAGSIIRKRIELKGLLDEYDRGGASSTILKDKIKVLTMELNAGEQATGRFARQVGNYELSLSKVAKGLKGLGGLGKILSNALGVDPEAAMAVQELARVVKDIHHVEGLSTATKTEQTAATTAHTAAVEAETVAEEEESAVSSLAIGLWGLLTAAIIAGSVALYEWITRNKNATEEWANQNETIKQFREEVKKLNEEIAKANIQLDEQSGRLTKFQAEQSQLRIKELSDVSGIANKVRAETKKIQEEQESFWHSVWVSIKGVINPAAAMEDAAEAAMKVAAVQIEAEKVLGEKKTLQDVENKKIEVAMAKKHQDELFELQQKKLEELKGETEYKKQQIDIQYQMDINAIEHSKQLLIRENGYTKEQQKIHDLDLKIALQNRNKALEGLEEDHVGKMVSMQDQINRYKAGQALTGKVAKTDLLNSGASDKDIKNKTRDQEIEDLKKDISLEMKYNLDAVDDKLKLAQLEYDKKKELRDKELEERKQMMDTEFKAMQDLVSKESELKLASLKTDAESIATEEQVQATLAAAGKRNSLDAERAAAAKNAQEQKIVQRKEAQEQQALALSKAFIDSYDGFIKKGDSPSKAIGEALSSVALAKGIATGLMAAFFHGTADTGQGGGLDGKGGFAAILHPNEAVITKNRNKEKPGLSQAWLDGDYVTMASMLMPHLGISDDHISDRGITEKMIESAMRKAIEDMPRTFTYQNGNNTELVTIKGINKETIIIPETHKEPRIVVNIKR